MIPTNHDGCFQFAIAHHLVKRESRAITIAQTNPADARRQSLKRDAIARQIEPTMQARVTRKQFLHFRVCFGDVFEITT